ncbi:putative Regulator of V-ATPase in vacuolar membrane protein 1 [Blattamonas nauphoetae]|uniref:Regulator of V-ATPase in vacuolar membrane protein 1 n=1 Tax=Blattamonas nauphoetae TaxID=2049346 RepID=A0ABQ9YFU2_9EUKA|nr:putative Regulator of V-ATPase in vacuolar membrane protein 1 [Blattamonas nauphoetae]
MDSPSHSSGGMSIYQASSVGAQNEGTPLKHIYISGDLFYVFASGTSIVISFSSFYPATILTVHTSTITAFDISLSTGAIIACSKDAITIHTPTKLLDKESLSWELCFSLPLHPEDTPISAVAWSTSGDHFCTASGDSLLLWTFAKHQRVSSQPSVYTTSPSPVQSPFPTTQPDNSLLLEATKDCGPLVYVVQARVLCAGLPAPVIWLDFDSSDTFIATLSRNSPVVEIWWATVHHIASPDEASPHFCCSCVHSGIVERCEWRPSFAIGKETICPSGGKLALVTSCRGSDTIEGSAYVWVMRILTESTEAFTMDKRRGSSRTMDAVMSLQKVIKLAQKKSTLKQRNIGDSHAKHSHDHHKLGEKGPDVIWLDNDPSEDIRTTLLYNPRRDCIAGVPSVMNALYDDPADDSLDDKSLVSISEQQTHPDTPPISSIFSTHEKSSFFIASPQTPFVPHVLSIVHPLTRELPSQTTFHLTYYHHHSYLSSATASLAPNPLDFHSESLTTVCTMDAVAHLQKPHFISVEETDETNPTNFFRTNINRADIADPSSSPSPNTQPAVPLRKGLTVSWLRTPHPSPYNVPMYTSDESPNGTQWLLLDTTSNIIYGTPPYQIPVLSLTTDMPFTHSSLNLQVDQRTPPIVPSPTQAELAQSLDRLGVGRTRAGRSDRLYHMPFSSSEMEDFLVGIDHTSGDVLLWKLNDLWNSQHGSGVDVSGMGNGGGQKQPTLELVRLFKKCVDITDYLPFPVPSSGATGFAPPSSPYYEAVSAIQIPKEEDIDAVDQGEQFEIPEKIADVQNVEHSGEDELSESEDWSDESSEFTSKSTTPIPIVTPSVPPSVIMDMFTSSYSWIMNGPRSPFQLVLSIRNGGLLRIDIDPSPNSQVPKSIHSEQSSSTLCVLDGKEEFPVTYSTGHRRSIHSLSLSSQCHAPIVYEASTILQLKQSFARLMQTIQDEMAKRTRSPSPFMKESDTSLIQMRMMTPDSISEHIVYPPDTFSPIPTYPVTGTPTDSLIDDDSNEEADTEGSDTSSTSDSSSCTENEDDISDEFNNLLTPVEDGDPLANLESLLRFGEECTAIIANDDTHILKKMLNRIGDVSTSMRTDLIASLDEDWSECIIWTANGSHTVFVPLHTINLFSLRPFVISTFEKSIKKEVDSFSNDNEQLHAIALTLLGMTETQVKHSFQKIFDELVAFLRSKQMNTEYTPTLWNLDDNKPPVSRLQPLFHPCFPFIILPYVKPDAVTSTSESLFVCRIPHARPIGYTTLVETEKHVKSHSQVSHHPSPGTPSISPFVGITSMASLGEGQFTQSPATYCNTYQAENEENTFFMDPHPLPFSGLLNLKSKTVKILFVPLQSNIFQAKRVSSPDNFFRTEQFLLVAIDFATQMIGIWSVQSPFLRKPTLHLFGPIALFFHEPPMFPSDDDQQNEGVPIITSVVSPLLGSQFVRYAVASAVNRATQMEEGITSEHSDAAVLLMTDTKGRVHFVTIESSPNRSYERILSMSSFAPSPALRTLTTDHNDPPATVTCVHLFSLQPSLPSTHAILPNSNLIASEGLMRFSHSFTSHPTTAGKEDNVIHSVDIFDSLTASTFNTDPAAFTRIGTIHTPEPVLEMMWVSAIDYQAPIMPSYFSLPHLATNSQSQQPVMSSTIDGPSPAVTSLLITLTRSAVILHWIFPPPPTSNQSTFVFPSLTFALPFKQHVPHSLSLVSSTPRFFSSPLPPSNALSTIFPQEEKDSSIPVPSGPLAIARAGITGKGGSPCISVVINQSIITIPLPTAFPSLPSLFVSVHIDHTSTLCEVPVKVDNFPRSQSHVPSYSRRLYQNADGGLATQPFSVEEQYQIVVCEDNISQRKRDTIHSGLPFDSVNQLIKLHKTLSLPSNPIPNTPQLSLELLKEDGTKTQCTSTIRVCPGSLITEKLFKSIQPTILPDTYSFELDESPVPFYHPRSILSYIDFGLTDIACNIIIFFIQHLTPFHQHHEFVEKDDLGRIETFVPPAPPFHLLLSGKTESSTSLSSEHISLLRNALPRYSIHRLSEMEKRQLYSLADLLLHTTVLSKGGLDEMGVRYIASVRIVSPLNFDQSPPTHPTVSLPSHVLLWAAFSTTQDVILDLILPTCKTWEDLKHYGIGFWLKGSSESQSQNTVQSKLITFIEDLCKDFFRRTKDPKRVALWYLALGKKNLLMAMFKAQNDTKMVQFFAHNFTEERWKRAALKNAYTLVGRQEYDYAAAFYLVAGETDDAVNMCVKMMDDVQLGLVVSQLVDSTQRKEKSVLSTTVDQHITPLSELKHDKWMVVMGHLLKSKEGDAIEYLLSEPSLKGSVQTNQVILNVLRNPLRRKYIPDSFYALDENGETRVWSYQHDWIHQMAVHSLTTRTSLVHKDSRSSFSPLSLVAFVLNFQSEINDVVAPKKQKAVTPSPSPQASMFAPDPFAFSSSIFDGWGMPQMPQQVVETQVEEVQEETKKLPLFFGIGVRSFSLIILLSSVIQNYISLFTQLEPPPLTAHHWPSTISLADDPKSQALVQRQEKACQTFHRLNIDLDEIIPLRRDIDLICGAMDVDIESVLGMLYRWATSNRLYSIYDLVVTLIYVDPVDQNKKQSNIISFFKKVQTISSYLGKLNHLPDELPEIMDNPSLIGLGTGPLRPAARRPSTQDVVPSPGGPSQSSTSIKTLIEDNSILVKVVSSRMVQTLRSASSTAGRFLLFRLQHIMTRLCGGSFQSSLVRPHIVHLILKLRGSKMLELDSSTLHRQYWDSLLSKTQQSTVETTQLLSVLQSILANPPTNEIERIKQEETIKSLFSGSSFDNDLYTKQLNELDDLMHLDVTDNMETSAKHWAIISDEEMLDALEESAEIQALLVRFRLITAQLQHKQKTSYETFNQYLGSLEHQGDELVEEEEEESGTVDLRRLFRTLARSLLSITLMSGYSHLLVSDEDRLEISLLLHLITFIALWLKGDCDKMHTFVYSLNELSPPHLIDFDAIIQMYRKSVNVSSTTQSDQFGVSKEKTKQTDIELGARTEIIARRKQDSSSFFSLRDIFRFTSSSFRRRQIIFNWKTLFTVPFSRIRETKKYTVSASTNRIMIQLLNERNSKHFSQPLSPLGVATLSNPNNPVTSVFSSVPPDEQYEDCLHDLFLLWPMKLTEPVQSDQSDEVSSQNDLKEEKKEEDLSVPSLNSARFIEGTLAKITTAISKMELLSGEYLMRTLTLRKMTDIFILWGSQFKSRETAHLFIIHSLTSALFRECNKQFRLQASLTARLSALLISPPPSILSHPLIPYAAVASQDQYSKLLFSTIKPADTMLLSPPSSGGVPLSPSPFGSAFLKSVPPHSASNSTPVFFANHPQAFTQTTHIVHPPLVRPLSAFIRSRLCLQELTIGEELNEMQQISKTEAETLKDILKAKRQLTKDAMNSGLKDTENPQMDLISQNVFANARTGATGKNSFSMSQEFGSELQSWQSFNRQMNWNVVDKLMNESRTTERSVAGVMLHQTRYIISLYQSGIQSSTYPTPSENSVKLSFHSYLKKLSYFNMTEQDEKKPTPNGFTGATGQVSGAIDQILMMRQLGLNDSDPKTVSDTKLTTTSEDESKENKEPEQMSYRALVEVLPTVVGARLLLWRQDQFKDTFDPFIASIAAIAKTAPQKKTEQIPQKQKFMKNQWKSIIHNHKSHFQHVSQMDAVQRNILSFISASSRRDRLSEESIQPSHTHLERIHSVHRSIHSIPHKLSHLINHPYKQQAIPETKEAASDQSLPARGSTPVPQKANKKILSRLILLSNASTDHLPSLIQPFSGTAASAHQQPSDIHHVSSFPSEPKPIGHSHLTRTSSVHPINFVQHSDKLSWVEKLLKGMETSILRQDVKMTSKPHVASSRRKDTTSDGFSSFMFQEQFALIDGHLHPLIPVSCARPTLFDRPTGISKGYDKSSTPMFRALLFDPMLSVFVPLQFSGATRIGCAVAGISEPIEVYNSTLTQAEPQEGSQWSKLLESTIGQTIQSVIPFFGGDSVISSFAFNKSKRQEVVLIHQKRGLREINVDESLLALNHQSVPLSKVNALKTTKLLTSLSQVDTISIFHDHFSTQTASFSNAPIPPPPLAPSPLSASAIQQLQNSLFGGGLLITMLDPSIKSDPPLGSAAMVFPATSLTFSIPTPMHLTPSPGPLTTMPPPTQTRTPTSVSQVTPHRTLALQTPASAKPVTQPLILRLGTLSEGTAGFIDDFLKIERHSGAAHPNGYFFYAQQSSHTGKTQLKRVTIKKQEPLRVVEKQVTEYIKSELIEPIMEIVSKMRKIETHPLSALAFFISLFPPTAPETPFTLFRRSTNLHPSVGHRTSSPHSSSIGMPNSPYPSSSPPATTPTSQFHSSPGLSTQNYFSSIHASVNTVALSDATIDGRSTNIILPSSAARYTTPNSLVSSGHRTMIKHVMSNYETHPLSFTMDKSIEHCSCVDSHPFLPLYVSGHRGGNVLLWKFGRETALAHFHIMSSGIEKSWHDLYSAMRPPTKRTSQSAFESEEKLISQLIPTRIRFEPVYGTTVGMTDSFGGFSLWSMNGIWTKHAWSAPPPILRLNQLHMKRSNDFVFIGGSGYALCAVGDDGAGSPSGDGCRTISMIDSLLPPHQQIVWSLGLHGKFDSTGGGVNGGCTRVVHCESRRELITGGAAGNIVAVDMRMPSGGELWSLPRAHKIGGYAAQSAAISALAIDEWEQSFVSASADGEIRLWDLSTHTLLAATSDAPFTTDYKSIPRVHNPNKTGTLPQRSSHSEPIITELALTPSHLYSCGASGSFIVRQLFY